MELLCNRVTMFNSLSNYQTAVQVTIPFHISIQNVQELQHFFSSSPPNVAVLMGLKWYLIVVFICISLMTMMLSTVFWDIVYLYIFFGVMAIEIPSSLIFFVCLLMN